MNPFDCDPRWGLGIPDEATRETAYLQWCKAHGLDPEDTESMIAYEGGWEAAMFPEDE